MGMDRTSIYRRAMQCLGEAEYVTGAPSEKACEVAYKPTLLEAAARYNWSFTRCYARVQGEECGVPGKVLYKLPSDCVKLVSVTGVDGRRVREPELCASGLLLPKGEEPEVVMAYHSDLSGVEGVLEEARTVLFVEGVVRLLASKVCMPLTSNTRLAEAMRAEAEEYFYRAILVDKQQDWSNAKEPRTMLYKRNIY